MSELSKSGITSENRLAWLRRTALSLGAPALSVLRASPSGVAKGLTRMKEDYVGSLYVVGSGPQYVAVHGGVALSNG